MAAKTVEELRTILGTENPRIARMLRLADREPSRLGLVLRSIDRELRAAGLSLDKLTALRRWVGLPTEGLRLGTAQPPLGDPQEVRLPLGILDRDLGIFGPIGSGKTTLAMLLAVNAHRAGTPSVVIDTVGDWRRTQNMLPPGDVVVLRPGVDFGINPFVPPPGVDPRYWDMRLLSGPFRQACWLRDGSENLALEVLDQMRKEWHVRERIGQVPPGEHPCLGEFIAILKRRSFSVGTRGSAWRESLLRACNELQMALGTCLCVHSGNLAALEGKTLVFELKLTGTPLLFLAYLLLCWWDAYLRFGTPPTRRPPAGQPRLLVVLEEYHRIGGVRLAARADVLELAPCEVMRTLRAAGGGVIVLDQVPSLVPTVVLANTLSKVVFRLASAPCLAAMSQSLGLSHDERGVLNELPDREALLSWPLDARPFVFRVPDVALPAIPTDDEVAARQAALCLAVQPCVTPLPPFEKEKRRPTAAGFSDDQRRVLAVLAEGPSTLDEIIRRANLSDAGHESRVRDGLVAQLLVKKETVGNKRVVVYLSDDGALACASIGLRVSKYHSGPGHEYLRRVACDGLLKAFRGAAVLRTGAVNGVQPDARVVDEANRRVIALQVAYSDNAEQETTSARKLLEAMACAAFARVVVVCRRTTLRRLLERTLRRELAPLFGLRAPERLVLLDADTVLAPGFSWREALRLQS